MTAMAEARTCPVDGCNAPIEAGKLLCRTHWFSLPRAMRAEVLDTWRAFRRRDGDPEERRGSLAQYRAAVAAALARLNAVREAS